MPFLYYFPHLKHAHCILICNAEFLCPVKTQVLTPFYPKRKLLNVVCFYNNNTYYSVGTLSVQLKYKESNSFYKIFKSYSQLP